MAMAAALPYGDSLYRLGQKSVGRLRAKPMSRLPSQVEMMHWLCDHEFSPEEKTFFEVGTGHVPLVPVGFFLSGVGQVITVDLHHRIDWQLTQESLRWISQHRDEVRALYADTVHEELFNERHALLTEWRDHPKLFLEKADIQYLAPADAACTRLPANSVDCHFSVTVLEHIPPDVLTDIFAEARRILRPDGYAIHFIDPSDHFQHQDKAISRINFLQYSDSTWNRIAGNEYAYCNRLRSSDYRRMFRELLFQTVRWLDTVDHTALRSLENGFSVHRCFQAYTPEDLCTTTTRVMLAHGS